MYRALLSRDLAIQTVVSETSEIHFQKPDENDLWVVKRNIWVLSYSSYELYVDHELLSHSWTLCCSHTHYASVTKWKWTLNFVHQYSWVLSYSLYELYIIIYFHLRELSVLSSYSLCFYMNVVVHWSSSYSWTLSCPFIGNASSNQKEMNQSRWITITLCDSVLASYSLYF